jgi:hypothetical protein
MDLRDNLIQVLVSQKTLFKAFVQEIAMCCHDIINSFTRFKLLFELMIIRLKHLNLHIVHVVFAELKHPVPQGVRLLKGCLHVALFGALMLEPDLFEVFFSVFALEEVSEDELVLVYCSFRDDQG